MTPTELEHLERLAEIEALDQALRQWTEQLPEFSAARQIRSLMDRLLGRVGQLRVRLEAPLVVATLGGTGTGKSSLVNALVGSEVSPSGRKRPTTSIPTLICRPDISPQQLGIDPAKVHLVQRDLAFLRDMVLLDCPDPDTSETADQGGSNLARLRELLPHCDVLLVTTTQQKYRSARVAEELAAAASGARLVFVQTHADVEDDIRADWRRMLEQHYDVGEMFFVDSVSALADAQQGICRGEFARLVEFLTRELAGTAAKRIRRANFVDLLHDTLARCRERFDEWMPAIEGLRKSLEAQRKVLAESLVRRLRHELAADRREWERLLLAELAARWGSSPFAWVVRLYLGLGGLVTRAALLRSRSSAQMVLWGSVEAARMLGRRRRARQAVGAAARVAQLAWTPAELGAAATIVAGYARDAGMPTADRAVAHSHQLDDLQAEAVAAAEAFLARAAQDVSGLVARLADLHRGWLLRGPLEVLLAGMVLALVLRLAYNFFYASWLANPPQPLLGLDYYLTAGFWLALWCALLVWLLSWRLRRGLNRQIDALCQNWMHECRLEQLFAAHEHYCNTVSRAVDNLERLQARVQDLRQQLELSSRLGRRYQVPAVSA